MVVPFLGNEVVTFLEARIGVEVIASFLVS